MSQIFKTGKWNVVPELMRSGRPGALSVTEAAKALLVVLTPSPASLPTDPRSQRLGQAARGLPPVVDGWNVES